MSSVYSSTGGDAELVQIYLPSFENARSYLREELVRIQVPLRPLYAMSAQGEHISDPAAAEPWHFPMMVLCEVRHPLCSTSSSQNSLDNLSAVRGLRKALGIRHAYDSASEVTQADIGALDELAESATESENFWISVKDAPPFVPKSQAPLEIVSGGTPLGELTRNRHGTHEERTTVLVAFKLDKVNKDRQGSRLHVLEHLKQRLSEVGLESQHGVVIGSNHAKNRRGTFVFSVHIIFREPQHATKAVELLNGMSWETCGSIVGQIECRAEWSRVQGLEDLRLLNLKTPWRCFRFF